jgi:hypothetical protein
MAAPEPLGTPAPRASVKGLTGPFAGRAAFVQRRFYPQTRGAARLAPGRVDMADKSQSPPKQTESTPHACDAPGLSGTQFLYSIMRDRTLDLRTRIKAASKLMAIEPDGPPKPRCKMIIGGIPPEYLAERQGQESVAPSPEPPEDTHSVASSNKGPSHMTTTPGSPDIETIISDIKSGNYPQPTLCTICGHYMPYPCSTSKTPIN